jgi:putative transposase
MVPSTAYRSGRHCVFQVHAHLVFTPKYRRHVFTKNHIEALRQYFQVVCESAGAELVELNGETDHVHLLVDYPPHVTLSALVNSLKGVSSRRLRRDFPEVLAHLHGGSLWSRSYFAASCGGAPLELLKKYIEDQRTPS